MVDFLVTKIWGIVDNLLTVRSNFLCVLSNSDYIYGPREWGRHQGYCIIYVMIFAL